MNKRLSLILMIFGSKPVPGSAMGLERDNIHTIFREGISGWLLLQLDNSTFQVFSYLTPKHFTYRCEGFLYWSAGLETDYFFP